MSTAIAEEILRLLTSSRGRLFSVKEVGKFIDRDRSREDANWAKHQLKDLFEQEKIDRDDSGFYFAPKPELLSTCPGK